MSDRYQHDSGLKETNFEVINLRKDRFKPRKQQSFRLNPISKNLFNKIVEPVKEEMYDLNQDLAVELKSNL